MATNDDALVLKDLQHDFLELVRSAGQALADGRISLLEGFTLAANGAQLARSVVAVLQEVDDEPGGLLRFMQLLDQQD